MKTVLLNTPDTSHDKRSRFGGGYGGYVQMAKVLLTTFESDEFVLTPCYHSVRYKGWTEWPRKPIRLIQDVWAVVRMSKGASALHMTLQYRGAIIREFAIVAAARLLKLPVLVDIRAGAFETWYRSTSALKKRMARYVIEKSDAIAVEGAVYIDFIDSEFGRRATLFPNYVPSSEIPETVAEKCRGEVLRLMFVGYAYDGKGVKELVEGCEIAAADGVPVHLTIVGSETLDIAEWLDARQPVDGFSIDRPGTQPHERVLELSESHDVFSMPTRHPGEGHSNAMNEAMMMGMVILITRHGFIPSVLPEDACYFVEKNSPKSVAEAIVAIHRDPAEARLRAARAHARLRERYSSDVVIPILDGLYRRLVNI